MSALALQDMVYGQKPLISLKSSFKLVSRIDSTFGPSTLIDIPLTSTEAALETQPHLVKFQFPNVRGKLNPLFSSVIQFDRSTFDSEFDGVASNPVSIYMDNFDVCGSQG